jgi:hypothetical protein
VEIDGEPWFVAADVCEALGMSLNGGTGQWLRHLTPEEQMVVPKGLFHGKGMNQAKLISESGLYKLVMRSDKPEAKEFQHWVTAVVLPTIRKDGRRPGCFLRKVCERIRVWPLRDFPPVPPVGRCRSTYAANDRWVALGLVQSLVLVLLSPAICPQGIPLWAV